MDPALVQELVSARRRNDPLAELSPREREVLALMAEGKSNAGIAQAQPILDITPEEIDHILKINVQGVLWGIQAAARKFKELKHGGKIISAASIAAHDGFEMLGAYSASKFAVREATRGLMPESVRLRRTKLGFAGADQRWLNGDLRPQVTELIESRLRCERFVDPAPLRQWYRSSASRSANVEAYGSLFRIMSLEMWMRAFDLS